MIVVTCHNRTFEEVKEIALSETDKRAWSRSDCWSEVKET